MKLPYELSAEQRAALEPLQTALAKPAKQHAAVLKKLANWRAIESKVVAAIAALESQADGTNEKAAMALAGRQQQIVLLRKSLRRGQEEIGPPFLDGLRGVVHRAHAQLHGILFPMVGLHCEAIATLLAPYCESAIQAEIIVKQQVPSYSYVLGFCGESFRSSMPDVPTALAFAAEKLALVEALLAGNDLFPDYAEIVAARQPRRPRAEKAAPQLSAEQISPQASPIRREDRAGQPAPL